MPAYLPYHGLCLDLETGGFDYRKNAVTSIHARGFTVEPDAIKGVRLRRQGYSYSANIIPANGLTVTAGAARVQGKSIEELLYPSDGVTEKEALLDLRGFINDTFFLSRHSMPGHILMGMDRYTQKLVAPFTFAHFAEFDQGFLAAMCERCGFETPGRMSCTLQMAQQLVWAGILPAEKLATLSVGGSLDTLLAYFELPGRKGKGHEGSEDTSLTIDVLEKLLQAMCRGKVANP